MVLLSFPHHHGPDARGKRRRGFLGLLLQLGEGDRFSAVVHLHGSVLPLYLRWSPTPADPFSSKSGCGIFRFINSNEAKFLSEWGRLLNERIHLEAVRNGFFSVSGITDSFRPHGYCAGQVQTGMRGPDGTPVQVGAQSYFLGLTESIVTQLNIDGTIHPNRRGHEAIRDALLAAIAAKKPDRRPTHRATVIVERVRFDLPQFPEIKGSLEFSSVPYESIDNKEVVQTDTGYVEASH